MSSYHPDVWMLLFQYEMVRDGCYHQFTGKQRCWILTATVGARVQAWFRREAVTIVQGSEGQASGRSSSNEEWRSCSGDGRSEGPLGRPNGRLDRLGEGEPGG